MFTRPCDAWIAAVLAASTLIVGCRETTAPGGPDVPLVPLAVGNHWTYQSSDSVEFGSWPPGPPRTLDVAVLRDTVIGGERWFAIGDTAQIFSSGHALFLANRPDGLYEFEPLAGIVLPPAVDLRLLRFPYPTSAGARFGVIGNSVVTSVDTLVTVPAGTFHCVRYEYQSPYGDPDVYLVAPGIGVVARLYPASEVRDATGQLIARVRFVQRLARVSLTPS
jgi:hypothetical protein